MNKEKVLKQLEKIENLYLEVKNLLNEAINAKDEEMEEIILRNKNILSRVDELVEKIHILVRIYIQGDSKIEGKVKKISQLAREIYRLEGHLKAKIEAKIKSLREKFKELNRMRDLKNALEKIQPVKGPSFFDKKV